MNRLWSGPVCSYLQFIGLDLKALDVLFPAQVDISNEAFKLSASVVRCIPAPVPLASVAGYDMVKKHALGRGGIVVANAGHSVDTDRSSWVRFPASPLRDYRLTPATSHHCTCSGGGNHGVEKGDRGGQGYYLARCSGVELLRRKLGDGKVVDKVMLATLITGPLTGEIITTDGTSSQHQGYYGRTKNPTGQEPVYKFITNSVSSSPNHIIVQNPL
jgi:hypothetical protein